MPGRESTRGGALGSCQQWRQFDDRVHWPTPAGETADPGCSSSDTMAHGPRGRRAFRDVRGPMKPKFLSPGADRRIAVGYLRRSTDRQEQSIPDQRAALERYAFDHGLTIARFYIDDAISGTTATRRPGFQEMVADAQRDPIPFSYVVVYDVKRFGRLGNDEAGYYRHILHTRGVEVLYVSENFSGDGTDDLLRPVKQWQAREESKDLSKVTIRGLLSKVSGGSWMGGTPPYGYDLRYQNDRSPDGEFLFVLRYMTDGTKQMLDDGGNLLRALGRDEGIVISKRDRARLVPSAPVRVATIERIFRLSAEENRGLRAVADVLNSKGVPSPRGPGYSQLFRGTWTAASIRSILINPIYVGDMVWNRRTEARFHRISEGRAVERRDLPAAHLVDNPESDWIRIENAHPALVSRRLFELAREAREGRPTSQRQRGSRVSGGWKGPRSRYLLSGLVICARCRGRYEGTYRRKGKARVDGSIVLTHYYGCSSYIRRGRSTCSFGPVEQGMLEPAVTRIVLDHYAPLLDGDIEARLAAIVREEREGNVTSARDERTRVRNEALAAERTIANLLDNITPTNREHVDERLRVLGRERDTLHRRLRELEMIALDGVEDQKLVREAWGFLAELPSVLQSGTPEMRVTAIRRCVESVVLDSEARSAVVNLHRLPAGILRGGLESRHLVLPPAACGGRPKTVLMRTGAARAS